MKYFQKTINDIFWFIFYPLETEDPDPEGNAMKNRIRRLDQDLDSFRGNIYRVSITNVDDMYGVILYKVGKCFAFLLP